MPMRGHLNGTYVPGDSLLHRLDPRAKFFGFLCLIAAIVLTDSPAGAALMIAGTIACAGLSGLAVASSLAPVGRLWSFFLVIFGMNALFFTSEDPLWHWGIISLSQEGLLQGASVVFRVALIIVLSGLLTQTTPPMGIMTAIQTMVGPLRYLHLPAEEIAMILSIALQFIPTLLEESDTIRKAQIARGARFESKRLHQRAMAMLPMVVPIFLAAFRRADELSVAMEARGYRGAKHRTARNRVPMDRMSWLALSLCAVVTAVQIVL